MFSAFGRARGALCFLLAPTRRKRETADLIPASPSRRENFQPAAGRQLMGAVAALAQPPTALLAGRPVFGPTLQPVP